MKPLVLFFAVCLMLSAGRPVCAEDSFFELSSEKIEKAIQYGTTADYKFNEFGGYDLGLNKFSLGDKTGYIDFVTPFVRIAGLSLKMKNSGKKVSFEEAKERTRKPVELRVFLYVGKEDLKDPMTCLIKTEEDSIDISGMVMEFSTCDDKSGECVRTLSYLFPALDLKKEQTFQVILKGKKLGEKKVGIKTGRIK